MRRARHLRLVPALAVLGLFVAACGSASEAERAVAKADAAARQSRGPTPCGTRARPPRRWRHVVWIVMENKAANQIIGAPRPPT